MAIIQPQPKSLRELIRDKYYQVPLYQRPYDWDIEHVSDLLNDIINNETGYFLGTVLFIPKTGQGQHPDNFEVVDGQQRLATLLLLLSAAIEVLENNKEKKDANDFRNQYVAQKPAGEPATFTLTLSKQDKDKFESLLTQQIFSKKPIRASWRSLDKTIQFFRDHFNQLNKEHGTKGVMEFLKKVLKLSFLEIQLGTDSDVYQYFETLNDRGKDLSIADLVKNRVCAQATKQHKSIEDSALTIDHISDEIGRGKFQPFLLHYCWANDEKEKKPIPRKKLMDWYGTYINAQPDVKTFLDHLEKQALQYYFYFVNPNKTQDLKKQFMFTYFDALGATRCYPLLLAGEEYIKNKKDFITLCKAIEVLTFRHSTILQKDAKSLEGVFFDLIKDIRRNKPITDIVGVLMEQDAMKNDDLFKLAFSEYTTEKNHKLARYILWKIEEARSGEGQVRTYLSGDLTLEHILAEKLKWDGREEYLDRLGNFTLLSPDFNRKAADKPFKEKQKEIYKKERKIEITRDLMKYSDFTKETIEKRQKELAEKAVDIWSAKSVN